MSPSFKGIARVLILFITLCAGTMLAGFIFHIPLIVKISTYFPAMKQNSAISFVLLGISFWLINENDVLGGIKSITARILACIVFFIGAITISEYVMGWNTGIEHLIHTYRDASNYSFFGRMAFLTAVNFTLLGAAVNLVMCRKEFCHYIAHVMTVIAGMISLFSILGYIYGAGLFCIDPRYGSSMAVYCSAMFIVACLALFFSTHQKGFMKNVSSEYYGGFILRSILPVAITAPVMFGWFKVQSEITGIISNRAGVASVALLNITTISICIYILSAYINKSERKRKETEKIAKDDMLKVAKLESLGLLAGGIAHDFNNILMHVTGNINLAKHSIKNEAAVLELLNEAQKGSLEAASLTEQLLVFSKGSGPVMEPVSVVDAVRNAATFALRGSNCAFTMAAAEGLYGVIGDRGQINQVIDNILINAKQAMPEGGNIDISLSNYECWADNELQLKSGMYVCIKIQDQGSGIPKENLLKVFDPYFTTKKQGSGLGLAVSYSAIKNHGGTIIAKSETGQGATFEIYLPASFIAGVSKAIHEESIEKGEGRILLMDDEELVRKAAGRMLKYLGYEVEFAVNGEDAIALYRKSMEPGGRPFKGVILDLTIKGGIGGRDTIGELLRIDPGVKAIVSSGYSSDNSLEEFTSLGFRASLSKPYTVEKMSEAIKTAFG